MVVDLEHFDVEAAKQMKACKGKKGRKKDKYRPEFLENRYPKRDIPKTNYADIEIPDDDHFLCKGIFKYSECKQVLRMNIL